ncbi:MAG TPA: ABC transporter substrate-binding protein/permease, partial [Candidatus Polarisedimenticolia bacterium]|nr:ABC transporter substrate-binding protein/permease [Candidatus Polarisedimenticolia bacterium]
ANPQRNIGFEVDLADALARALDRPITFVQYDYKSLIPGLMRGDFDFAMNGIEITPDRKTRVLFTHPYYLFRLQLVVRAGDDRFTDLQGCRARGCIVGTLEDTAAERLLHEQGIATKIYDGQVEPYRDLALGRLDAVLLDLPIALYYARPDPRLKFVGAPIGRGYYAIAFRKDDTATRDEVDRALRQLIADGAVQRICERWGIWNADQSHLRTASPEDVLAESRRLWTPARYLPLLLRAAAITIELSLASMTLAILIGLPVALARLYGPPPLRWLATGYVEFFRGIPVLLLLYFLYYGLADLAAAHGVGFPLRLAPMQAAILGLGLNYASYEAEIYRAGIASVPPGQWEAAASLGMTGGLAFRRIILPQALRTLLPPMTNDFVALFKDTSIVSTIAVVELSKQYQILSKSSLKYLEMGAITAALYLVMSVPLGWLSRRLERIWGRGAA